MDRYGNYVANLPTPGVVPSGGGASSAAPDSIDYAGPPLTSPPAIQNIVVDSNGRQWMYWGGSWQ